MISPCSNDHIKIPLEWLTGHISVCSPSRLKVLSNLPTYRPVSLSFINNVASFCTRRDRRVSLGGEAKPGLRLQHNTLSPGPPHLTAPRSSVPGDIDFFPAVYPADRSREMCCILCGSGWSIRQARQWNEKDSLQLADSFRSRTG